MKLSLDSILLISPLVLFIVIVVDTHLATKREEKRDAASKSEPSRSN